MFPNLITTKLSSETTNQVSSHSENHSGSIDLVTQIGLIPIGLFAIFLISMQASIQSAYKSIAAKIYKTRDFYLNSFIIKHNIDIWEEQLRQTQELGPRDILIDAKYYTLRKKLNLTKEASKVLINGLFTQHLSTPNGSILEIGSNLLDENGHSYLASLLDSKFLSRFQYSDYSETIVQQDKRKEKNIPYLHVDATQLSKSIKKASLAHIVSVNVIDIISRNRLSDVVEGAYHTLRDHGKIVVLSDLHFGLNALFEKHSTEDQFPILYPDGKHVGLKCISKKLLLENAKQHGERFKNFINSLINTPQDKQLEFLLIQFNSNINLNAVLECLCDSYAYTTVDHEQSYLDDLNQAFASHGGFEIVKNGYEEHTKILSYPNRRFIKNNTISTDLRIPEIIQSSFSSQLEPNQLSLTSVFHVFIAQKRR